MKAFASTLLVAFLSVPAQAVVLGEDYLYSYTSDPNIMLRINSSASGISAAPTSGERGISTANADFFDPVTNTSLSSAYFTRVLEVDFADPIRTFAVDSTTATDVGLKVFIYDSNDQFVESFLARSTFKPIRSAANNGVFEPNRHAFFNFEFDVGKIVLGGAADNHWITSVSVPVSVPEPSIAYLFCGGLLSIVGGRIFGIRKQRKIKGEFGAVL